MTTSATETAPSGKSPAPSSAQGGGGGAAAAASASGSTTTEFEPPLACVRRLLKNSLPTCNVGKDASSAFARACGIFVIYLTACANDFARESKRQTITANDILAAVTELEFDEFTPQLKAFLEQHRAEERKKKRDKDAKKLQAAEHQAEITAQAAQTEPSGSGGTGGSDSGSKRDSGEADLSGAESPQKKLKPNTDGEKSGSPGKNESSAADGDGEKGGSDGGSGGADESKEEGNEKEGGTKA